MRKIVAFEDIEHLHELDAARRRRRHRDDVIAAIAAAYRSALHRAIGFQIVGRHHAAGGPHVGGKLLGDRPLVEGLRAVLRDALQRRGEIALDQPLARRQRRAVGMQENLHRRRPAPEPRLHAGQRIGDIVGDRDAVARHRDRRRDQLGKREMSGAVFLLGERQAGDGARHADGKR